MLSTFELISRIALGALLGGIIGFERDIHGRHVGLRTHLIVAMASATFMVVSSQFYFFQHYVGAEHVEVDVSRIAASVVSGIGFLAGGVILRTNTSIQGITTAAGLWLVTAIGMCAGAGMYLIGVTVTAMGLAALTVFRLFEDKNDKVIKRDFELEISEGSHRIRAVLDALAQMGVQLSDFDYDKRVTEKTVVLTFLGKIPQSLELPKLIEQIEGQPEVVHVRVRVPR